MELINALPKQINLGNQGESGITTIDVDCTAWLTDFPAGELVVTFLPPETYQTKLLPATQAYMLPDGATLRIIVNRNMTMYAGKGSLNIRLVEGDNIEKRSAVAGTYVAPSHPTAAEEMPADVEDWVDAAIAKLTEVDPAILAMAETEFASAAFVGDDLVLTKINGGTVTLTGAKTTLIGPRGYTGNGIASVLRTAGNGMPGTTDTYTIAFTDANTTTFTVYNGADGTYIQMPLIKQYIIRWDKVNSQCTRMGDASAITTTITNFKHSGSVNASYSNPFDSLYPWKYRKLCKVDRAAYAALVAKSPITDAVTAWEGEPGFVLDGTGDFDGVYTPEFWGRIWEDATYVYAGVADGEIPGWQYFEATIGGRYFGSMDGASKITSIAGSLPLRNTRMDTMHTNVTSQGMTLDDIFTWCADSLLMAVEFATLNSQTAIGSGCDGLYRQSAEVIGEAASISDTLLKLPNAFVAACIAGAIIGIGTSDGGEQVNIVRFISSADLDGADLLYATHKGVTITPLVANVTTSHFVSIHGCYNAPDAAIGSMSGYLGTNGKSNAYYRGRVAHANFFRYVLGAYRQTANKKIWAANSREEAAAVDALNTGVHRDTGLALPAANGYIAALGLENLLPLAPFCITSGGAAGATNPVGDYCYVPSLGTGNTILFAGGGAHHGAYCGRFCGNWSYTAATSHWHVAVLPFLKTP